MDELLPGSRSRSTRSVSLRGRRACSFELDGLYSIHSMASTTSVAYSPGKSAKRWTLIATIIASSMTFIDGTVVNVALPALQRDLGASITDVQWVIESYALFLGSLILVGGSLGDQLGRRRVFLSGVVVFTIASIVCGFAPSSVALIAGRAVQGIGAAFLVPGSLAIITGLQPQPRRLLANAHIEDQPGRLLLRNGLAEALAEVTRPTG